MSKIDRARFHHITGNGIDPDNKRLQRAAERAGVSREELAALDHDGDGLLLGDEIDDLYDILAGLDFEDDDVEVAPFDDPEVVRVRGGVDLGRNQSGEVGPDTTLFHGVADAISAPAERRIAIARAIAADPRLAQGFEGRSEGGRDNTMLTHNPMHRGERQQDGLIRTNFKDAYRCNLFVGDVVWRSGGRPPTVRGPGWVHYDLAERWPRSQNFEKVASLEDVRPGDILVIDAPESGSGGGHIEIITELTRDGHGVTTDMVSIGARWFENEIVEDNSRAVGIFDAEPVSDDTRRGAHFLDDTGTRYFILRPRGESVMEHQREFVVRG